MSPRPRKVSDDEVFVAAQRAISRLGPAELTLAHIADEAGLTAGALVQRFGSKRDLLLRLMERFSGGTGEIFAELRRGHRSPLAVLRAYAECMADMASSPEALLRNFAYYQMDLTDPVLLRNLVDLSQENLDLTAVLLVAGTPDEPLLLQPVHRTGHLRRAPGPAPLPLRADPAARDDHRAARDP